MTVLLLAMLLLVPPRGAGAATLADRNVRAPFEAPIGALPLATSARPARSVTLAWNPSPSAGVVSYNVYMGTNSRSYTVVTNAGGRYVWDAGDSVPTFRGWCQVRLKVWDGMTNFLAATAVDGWGWESDFSEELAYMPRVKDSVIEVWAKVRESTDLTTWSAQRVRVCSLTNEVGRRFWAADGMELSRTNY